MPQYSKSMAQALNSTKLMSMDFLISPSSLTCFLRLQSREAPIVRPPNTSYHTDDTRHPRYPRRGRVGSAHHKAASRACRRTPADDQSVARLGTQAGADTRRTGQGELRMRGLDGDAAASRDIDCDAVAAGARCEIRRTRPVVGRTCRDGGRAGPGVGERGRDGGEGKVRIAHIRHGCDGARHCRGGRARADCTRGAAGRAVAVVQRAVLAVGAADARKGRPLRFAADVVGRTRVASFHGGRGVLEWRYIIGGCESDEVEC
ncbi:hypothetical protein SCAR479_12616 [Seiridium cardinale]|uniref:Uncharacterized protein n=1 Tax=Seiridium cardinale TaxID=138064 RepID=A0ABR2XAE1_9PEZI